MVMMDTLSCSFCRHIFSTDLSRQILRVEDTIPKSAWIWNGDRWSNSIARNAGITHLVWFTAIFLWIIPAVMIGVPGYIFPPIGGLKWNSFSVLWGAATFGIHSLIAGWLLVEHYQLPNYIAAKITLQRSIAQIKIQINQIIDRPTDRQSNLSVDRQK
jgi:hypothetical protein